MCTLIAIKGILEIETLECSEMISVHIKISLSVYLQYFAFVLKKNYFNGIIKGYGWAGIKIKGEYTYDFLNCSCNIHIHLHE